MTRLLASVRNLEEARIALAGGAGIVDLKEPAFGALGAVPHATARTVTAYVDGRAPVSATIGDVPFMLHIIAPAVRAMAATGVDYIKIGLFAPQSDRSVDILDVVRAQLSSAHLLEAAGEARLVAVLFAERAPDFRVIGALASAGFGGVMLDTADKASGSLRSHLDEARLREFCRLARAHGLLTGLAGSLRLADIDVLLPLAPDYLGFRGALCEAGARTEDLSPRQVARIAARFSASSAKLCTLSDQARRSSSGA
jgi:uncharacterized protein (UPF0264 family)